MNKVVTTYKKRLGRRPRLAKRTLAWCPRHGTVIYSEGGKYVTMLPMLSCHCGPFSSDIKHFTTLTQVINQVSTIKHARRVWTLSIKNWKFHLVRY